MSAYDLAYCGVVGYVLLNPVETGHTVFAVLILLASWFVKIAF